TLTFTPSTPCSNPATTTVTVDVPGTPNLGTATLCQTDAPLNLSTLQDAGFPTGSWSGPGVSGTTFNPAGQSGNVTLTFTPSTPCTNPATTTVTVDLPVTPNLGTANLCDTDAPLNLSTLQDPGFPAGNWSGPGVSGTTFNPAGQSGPVVLTFTPTAPCTNPATTTVTVSVAGTPVLGTASLCQSDGPFDLSTIQDINYPSGTWSGPGVSGATFNPAGQTGNISLTFTPAASCALPASTTITVNVPTTPILGTATLCATDLPLDLTTLQDPGFPSGTWSGPGVSGTTFNPNGQNGAVVLTFTPSTPCTNPANATINVDAPTTPNLGTATLCETDAPLDLTTLQDPGFPSGTWSGPGVSGTTFNPNGQNGAVVLTFTPSTPCTNPANATINITTPAIPNLSPANLCETDPPLDLTTLQDPGFPSGSWSGPGVSGSTFDPVGLSGPVILTFTSNTPCTNPANTTVTVSAAGTPILGTASLCQSDAPLDLTALQDINYPGGVWSGPGVSGTTFNPAGQSGNISLTFTPSASCALPASTTIMVNVPTTPNLGTATLCQTDAPLDLTTLQDPGFPSGTWSGPGVSGATFNPAGQSGAVVLTFTPSTPCTNPANA
ncbi:MAG: hypothetical protein KDC32_26905, partial [Saprospiraceae bacterium]|nr:hypothetical protein [Saprospiraceae bacterium]